MAVTLLAACAPSRDEVSRQVGETVRAQLPGLLGVPALPPSVTDLECRWIDDQCTANVYRVQCALALDPADFGQLFDAHALLDDPHDQPSGPVTEYVDRLTGPDFEVDGLYGGTSTGAGIVLYTNRERNRALVHIIDTLDVDCD